MCDKFNLTSFFVTELMFFKPHDFNIITTKTSFYIVPFSIYQDLISVLKTMLAAILSFLRCLYFVKRTKNKLINKEHFLNRYRTWSRGNKNIPYKLHFLLIFWQHSWFGKKKTCHIKYSNRTRTQRNTEHATTSMPLWFWYFSYAKANSLVIEKKVFRNESHTASRQAPNLILVKIIITTKGLYWNIAGEDNKNIPHQNVKISVRLFHNSSTTKIVFPTQTTEGIKRAFNKTISNPVQTSEELNFF